MCLTPIKLKSGDVVPCSQCSECIVKHRGDWFVRLYQEGLHSLFVYFITLTYDDDHLPYADDIPVVNIPDVQKFFKLCRKFGLKFKYFGVAEYGEKSFRPHYHLLLFSHTMDLTQVESFVSKWKFGQTHVGKLTGASINYCLKDMLKERTLFKGIPRQLQPRLFCSKGLGSCYIEKSARWHKNDPLNRSYIAVEGEKRHLPRYYRDRIFSKFQRQKQNLLFQKKKAALELLSPYISVERKEFLERQLKVYSQFVEQQRAQQLKVRHINRSL